MKNDIKSHPLMFFTFLKPVLILALLPSARTVFQIIFLKTVGGFRFSETSFFIFLSLLAEFRRRSHSISLFEDFIIFKKGLYFKSEIRAERQRIISVYSRQNPIEKVFCAKTLFINVFSDKKEGYTFKITVKVKDAKKIIDFIKTEDRKEQKRFSLFKVAVFAAASSGTVQGLLLFVPTLKRTLNLFGIRLYDSILSRFIEKSNFEDKYMPRAVNFVVVAVFFIYIFGFLHQFFKNINFRLSANKTTLFLKSGIITKRESAINLKETVGLVAEQTLFLRIFRSFTLKAMVSGYTGRLLANGVIAPLLSASQLKNSLKDIFGFDSRKRQQITKQKAPFGPFSVIIFPLTLFTVLFAVFILVFLKFYNFRRFATLLFILSGIFLAFYAEILIYGYYKGKIIIDKEILLIGTRGLKTQRLYTKFENIGEIKLKENPFDRKRGSCKVSVAVFSKTKSTAAVRWIKKSDLLEKLTKYV